MQELTVPSYVANDTFIVGGRGTSSHVNESGDDERQIVVSPVTLHGTQHQTSMLLMTGPNYSGKSVHLKHVALIVYMAHVGCFVSADAATVGLTDRILTRIATKETITRAQSAFMLDLQQVTKALSLATQRSLVIVDEFGKGTNSNGKQVNDHTETSVAKNVFRRSWFSMWPVRALPQLWYRKTKGSRSNPFSRDLREWIPPGSSILGLRSYGSTHRQECQGHRGSDYIPVQVSSIRAQSPRAN